MQLGNIAQEASERASRGSGCLVPGESGWLMFVYWPGGEGGLVTLLDFKAATADHSPKRQVCTNALMIRVSPAAMGLTLVSR